jgi:hypothetical protein
MVTRLESLNGCPEILDTVTDAVVLKLSVIENVDPTVNAFSADTNPALVPGPANPKLTCQPPKLFKPQIGRAHV